MRPLPAYASYRKHAAVTAARATAILQRAAQSIAVEVVDAAQLGDMRAAWNELLGRADTPNVFMDPVLLQAAAAAEPRKEHPVLLAWKPVEGRRRLVGLWAFEIAPPRHSPLPIRLLVAPVNANCYLASPVLDRNELDETLETMLDAIVADPQLPHIIALDSMPTESATYAAMRRVLAARDSIPCELEHHLRPKLVRGLDPKTYLQNALSSSSRKKLRQHRRRLSEKGKLTSVVVTQPDDVRHAIERFLELEAAGWKAREGTALLCSPSDANLMRGAVAALAEHGRATIHVLALDDRPVSMQIVARSGRAAYTWKTAYDERFADYSPGMLLFEDYTAALLDDDRLDYADSCSYDDSGFMASWTDRIPVADLWIDAQRGGSIEFRMLAKLQKTYRNLRAVAKHAYLTMRHRQSR